MTDEKPRMMTRQEADQAQQDRVERETAEQYAETRAELTAKLGIGMFGGVPLAKDGSVTVAEHFSPTPAPDVTPTPPAEAVPPQEGDNPMTEPVYTQNARLLGAGWQPTDAIARLVLQREALWGALAELSSHARTPDALYAAIPAANRQGIVQAVTSNAVATWCDDQLQRRDTEVHALNAHLRNALSKEIAKDPQAVLDSLEGVADADGDGQLIRAEAEGYLEASQYFFSGATGLPVRAPAVESFSQVVPRHILPLTSSRAPAEALG